MKTPKPELSKLGFIKTFVLPALLVFLIPVFSWWFFRHVQADFDQQALTSIEKQIDGEAGATAEQRAKARAYFSEHPVSERLAASGPDGDNLRAKMPSGLKFDYALFRWMIRLSAFSILSGLGVFLLGGGSVWWSLRSQSAQYYSLSIGWHLLRLFSTLQVLIQAALAVALSFWVTAFWFHMYSIKLVAVAAVLAVVACFAVIAAIFRKIHDEFVVGGALIERTADSPLWADLDRICRQVGTPPPDRIIAGIDNNFFVTEHAVMHEGKVYEGRTLYVSLSLLKVLQGTQADAVMAHEMAHFSGDDTLFSKKIGPLLNRYEVYLQALRDGGLSLPVFYFMLCFRGLFQLSLGHRRREREFRADRIAAECTSAADIAQALVKVAAYSEYRGKVEQELLDKEQVLETVNIPQQISLGFPKFASTLVAEGKLNQVETAHPFDSHPPLDQRLTAVGVQLSGESSLAVLQGAADARWFRNIARAEELEQQQWAAYEAKFREFHEQVLAYRYRPDNDAERAVVLKYFPAVTLEGKKQGTLTIDHEKLHYSEWENAIHFSEMTKCTGEESALGHPQIRIDFQREQSEKRILPLDAFRVDQQAVMDAFNRFYSRHQAMLAYRKEKIPVTPPPSPPGSP